MGKITDEQTRERAHRIWESEGRPEGRAHEHWRQAERELSMEMKVELADETKARPKQGAPARKAKDASGPATKRRKPAS